MTDITETGHETLNWTNEAPWTKLGARRGDENQQTLEEFATEAGLNWKAISRPLFYSPLDSEEGMTRLNSHQVLLRSDTGDKIGVVGKGFRIVQPAEVLQFFADLIEEQGYEMEFAGSAAGGKRIWAVAKTNQEMRIFGQDHVTGYMQLSTGFDGSAQTVGMLSSLRTTCWNAMNHNIGAVETDGTMPVVKFSHRSSWDAAEMKSRLDVGEAWNRFEEQANLLANRKVTDAEALTFIRNVLGDPKLSIDDDKQRNKIGMRKVLRLYKGEGHGSELRSSEGTAWGLFNAVTEFCDHSRKAGNQGARMASSFFGQSAKDKERALGEALKLAA